MGRSPRGAVRGQMVSPPLVRCPMAESISEPMQRPAARPAEGTRPVQGSVTAHGTLAVYEPGSGKLVGEVRVSSAAQVREAAAASRAAQKGWAAKSFKERGQVLFRFQQLVLDRADELADLLVRENGKTRNEALFMEVLPVADLTHYFARKAERLLRDERVPLHMFPHKKSYLKFYPRGVIGIISPWNYPFSIPAGDTVMALLAGNGVVLKPSEFTPLVAERLRAFLEEAGVPRGLLQVVHGKGDVGAELIKSGVNMVVFTGSVATGRKVNVADADQDTAALKLAWGAFANSGQTCASVERVYVHESIAPQLTDKLVKLALGLRQGEPNSYDVDVGAMTTQMQVDIVKRHLDDARAKGAKVLAGGEVKVYPDGGRFVQPTVLTGVTHEMAIMRDETFGPMLPIMTFRTEEEAVRLANDSPYGLSAYVFTRDKAKADLLANQLLAGTVMHNDTLYTHAAPETPWGGVKASGLGRVHGKHGLRDLCEVRHVNLERFNFPAFWFYPYSAKAYRLGRRVYGTLIGTSLSARLKALLGR